MKYLFLLITAWFALGSEALHAQDADSVVKVPVARPTEVTKAMRAGLLSAVLPGAGQAYNKKYWKVPLVYGGAAGFGYFIRYYHNFYRDYRNALIISTDGNDDTENPFPLNTFSNEGLKRNRDVSRRYRDLNIILATAFYGLNIVDAIVDAHLSDFDVSDDLSLQLTPTLQPLPNGKTVWSLGIVASF